MGKAPTFEDVVRFGLTLPEVTQSTSYGRPALKVNKKVLTCMNTETDEPSLVIKLTSVDEQQHLLESDLTLYHITPHYEGWPGILMRLSQASMADVEAHLLRVYHRLAPKRALKAYEAAKDGA